VVVVTGSVALLADTIHNVSDALTAVPLWIAFIVGRRSASRRYTYGYGRAEDLAGVFIVGMIALSAVVAGVELLRRLLNPEPLNAIGALAAAGLIGFIGNEVVAVYRIRVGRRIGSAALVADGLHARTDSLPLPWWPARWVSGPGSRLPTPSSGCSSPWRSCSCCVARPGTSTGV
jgi:cation diffusion facilitator family transporter